MKIFSTLKLLIIELYTPAYSYTLEKNHQDAEKDVWIFKEYGTHSFVKKSWKQLQESNFLQQVNPKDIAYIAETEAAKKLEESKMYITEEKRNKIWVLKSSQEKLSVTGDEFINNPELIDKTESADATRIAFHTGLKKGLLISATLNTGNPEKPQKKGGGRLTIVK